MCAPGGDTSTVKILCTTIPPVYGYHTNILTSVSVENRVDFRYHASVLEWVTK